MKKHILLLLVITISSQNLRVHAQDQEIQQLLLNVEKLAQLKSILESMKMGYEVLSTGYNTIKDISEGNFTLHETFMEGLLAVNPAISKYRRVLDIINYQKRLVKEYKLAFQRFRSDPVFTIEELEYLAQVYSNLFRQSLQNLDELLMVTTARQLRMSDDERLQAIDRLFAQSESQLQFLRYFNSSVQILAVQRTREQNDTRLVQQLYN